MVQKGHGLSMTRRFVNAVASRLTRRRLVLTTASRFINHRFAFAVATVSTLSAKGVHIYAHSSALPRLYFGPWVLRVYSFFAQDILLLLILRLLLDQRLFEAAPSLRIVAKALVSVLIAYTISVGIIAVSFFAVCGSEIHWRSVVLAGDSSSWGLLVTGLTSFVLVLCVVLVTSWVSQNFFYILTGAGIDILMWPLSLLFRKRSIFRYIRARETHAKVPQHDIELAAKNEAIKEDFSNSKPTLLTIVFQCVLYLFVGAGLLIQISVRVSRPNDGVLNFMSWTPALLPFVDFTSSAPQLDELSPVYGSSIGHTWDNRTAVEDPISLPWLPKNLTTPGFEDWKSGKKQYNAAADPLKISNLDEGLLTMLRDKLADVPIRHVMLVILESTRKDVFPIKKEGLIWDRLVNSFGNRSLPDAAEARLATLTSTANLLTGDYEDGFKHDTKKRRGGFNFNKAFTTSTYTFKSIVGTMCGLTPLIADFNLEYLHHFYQPCLPHIFEAFNKLNHTNDDRTDSYTSFKWRSSFLQSISHVFDNFKPLTSALGYSSENFIASEYLRSDEAKFGPVDLPDINYFGMSEIAVQDYLRDAFVSAKKNNERLFLTHVTSTSHHPFAMPDDEVYIPLSNTLDDISHYLNAIGYDDRWLGKILDMLDKEGVADETLLVLVGDHGLSMPENDILSAYYNPNIGTLHVPLVVSHPKLPPIDVDDPVISLQILPTILDLLLETGSLSKSQSQAASDLIRNYEGQSLIRPIYGSSNQTGQGNWQFTVINPGRSMLALRDARKPDWSIIVPIVNNIEWRFTDLKSDPREEYPVLGFDFSTFLVKVEEKHGIDAGRWAEEAAFLARWWVEENGKRWHYGLYAD